MSKDPKSDQSPPKGLLGDLLAMAGEAAPTVAHAFSAIVGRIPRLFSGHGITRRRRRRGRRSLKGPTKAA